MYYESLPVYKKIYFYKNKLLLFWKVKMMTKIKKSILVELEAPDQRMLRYGSHIN